MNKTEILKVIVGSQAHGLANEKSDTDYRGVFIIPTMEFFTIPARKIDNTQWIEGNDDNTSWEIGHFLHLATQCNPTILETFLAPISSGTVTHSVTFGEDEDVTQSSIVWSQELRDLFPHVWNSRKMVEAFIGYGLNQRKKFLDNKDNRRAKYAVAYLRTLYNAVELLETGTFSVNMKDTPVYNTLKSWKQGDFSIGEVVGECEEWIEAVRRIEKEVPEKKANLEPVNDFLIKVRKDFW